MSSPGRPGPSPPSQALPAGRPTCCLLWPPHLGTPETMRAGSLQLEREGPGAWSFPPTHCPLPRPPLLSGELPAPSHGVHLPYTQNKPTEGRREARGLAHSREPTAGSLRSPYEHRKELPACSDVPPPSPGLLRCQGKELLPTASQGWRSSRSQVSIWHMMLSELELAPACPGPRVCRAASAVLVVALLERGLPSSSVLQGHACPCLPAHR